jgi:hypothetical protein
MVFGHGRFYEFGVRGVGRGGAFLLREAGDENNLKLRADF